MKINPVWRATNKKGVLTIANEPEFIKYCATLPEKVKLVVSKYNPQRSNQQNRYYRGVVVAMVAEEIGIMNEEAHDMLKEYCNFEIVHKNGFEIRLIKSTSALTTVQFEEYISRCVLWAVNTLSIAIPNPNQAEGEL